MEFFFPMPERSPHNSLSVLVASSKAMEQTTTQAETLTTSVDIFKAKLKTFLYRKFYFNIPYLFVE